MRKRRPNPPLPEGINLKQLREKAGFSQADVAKAFHTTVTTISRWERGEGTPHPIMLTALLSYYNFNK